MTAVSGLGAVGLVLMIVGAILFLGWFWLLAYAVADGWRRGSRKQGADDFEEVRADVAELSRVFAELSRRLGDLERAPR